MNRLQKVLPIALIAVFVFSATAMASFQGRGAGMTEDEREAKKIEMQNMTQEEREIVREEHQVEMEAHKVEVMAVIEAGDYDAWAALVAEHPHGEEMLEVINADNFDTFVEAHQKIEEGKSMLEELGLKRPKGKRMDGKRGMKKGMGRMQNK